MKVFCQTGSCVVVSLLLLVVIGCGSGNRASVSGEVTLDGQPVTKGSIAFIPAEGSGTKATGQIEDGKYSLEGDSRPAPGKYRVEIRWPRPTGKKVPVVDDPPNMIEEVKEAVPARYNTNSELKVELSSGSNTENFPLTTK